MCGNCDGGGTSNAGSCNPCICPPPCYPRCAPCCPVRVCPPPCCSQPITLNCIICKDPYECSPRPAHIPLHVCGIAGKPSGGSC